MAQGVGGTQKRGPKGPSKYTEDYVNQLADELLEYAETRPLPFLNKFALDRKMPAETLTANEAFKNNEKFCQSLKMAKDWLEYKVSYAGLLGKLNPAMAIFTLKNCAGWRDNREEKQVDDRLDDTFDFVGVPTNGGDNRFKKFMN